MISKSLYKFVHGLFFLKKFELIVILYLKKIWKIVYFKLSNSI